jgi:hypothetical protein
MGEASLSQLRFWTHALPTLVTRTGWYATLPESVVAHVRPDREQTDIMAHLGRFLEQPREYEALGQRGREWLVRYHGPDSYADTLLRTAEVAVQRRVELARNRAEDFVAPGLADLPQAGAVVRGALDALLGPVPGVRLSDTADAMAPRVQSVLGTLEGAVARIRRGAPAQRSASTSSS